MNNEIDKRDREALKLMDIIVNNSKRIDSLRTKLQIAVEALDNIVEYGDWQMSEIAGEAFAKIEELDGKEEG